MNTKHRFITGNSSDMVEVPDRTVHLTVTSPPYPMIEMWDEMFSEQDPLIGRAMELNMGKEAFERMHKLLDEVWEEVSRVTTPAGIVCVNIGDATRKLGKNFQCYPNAARITKWFFDNGFTVLPSIHWRKPTNKANKFMGSGMLAPSAYVTQEEESILVFRKGPTPRDFNTDGERGTRQASAYFYEERNKWFCDSWDDIPGSRQDGLKNSKRRLALYPVEIPHRLIHMYSIYGDTVLDPFAGSGTTLVAAMASGRSSIGYDLDEDMQKIFKKRIHEPKQLNSRFTRDRIHSHLKYVEETDRDFKYENKMYGFPVTNKAETKMRFYSVDSIKGGEGVYEVKMEPSTVTQELT